MTTVYKKNLFTAVPQDLPHELFELLAAGGDVRIERIVSRGHASSENFWYDQDTDEFVLLMQGRAGIIIAGQAEPVVLSPGDYLIIEAHLRHRVEWTASEMDTIWLAVHYPTVSAQK